MQIRSFIQKFYHFVDGVSQHHGNIDELLGKVSTPLTTSSCSRSNFIEQSLDRLLSNNISESIGKCIHSTSTLTQAAQIVSNVEHFEVACSELERSLTSLR